MLRDFEFTSDEVTFGVKNCGSDWNEEAVRAAKKQIEYNGEYSAEKMVYQLMLFDFTKAQAEYAVKILHLLPDENPERWRTDE